MNGVNDVVSVGAAICTEDGMRDVLQHQRRQQHLLLSRKDDKSKPAMTSVRQNQSLPSSSANVSSKNYNHKNYHNNTHSSISSRQHKHNKSHVFDNRISSKKSQLYTRQKVTAQRSMLLQLSPSFGRVRGSAAFCLAAWIGVCAVLVNSAHGQGPQEVSELGGVSDFSGVKLHWRYPRMGPDFRGFKITHCEDQAWGHHRCKNSVLDPSQLEKESLVGNQVLYTTRVGHLRMATNFTLNVTPIVDGAEPPRSRGDNGRAIDDSRNSANQATPQVFIQTKGFSAKAVSCLTNSTLVEVETGPHFGGKISVEGSQEPGCATHGNAKDSTTKYRLDIDHSLCGSKLLNESVRTYILVQENLPILTHSTRRFMVVCHYVPKAFTVSAGVSLPDESNSGPLIPVDQSINEVDPSELFDATNDIFSRSASRRQGKALRLEQTPSDATSPGMWTQLVLMVILIVGAVVGLSCAFWHFGRHAGFTARTRGESFVGGAEELDSVSCGGSVGEDSTCQSDAVPSGDDDSTDDNIASGEDSVSVTQTSGHSSLCEDVGGEEKLRNQEEGGLKRNVSILSPKCVYTNPMHDDSTQCDEESNSEVKCADNDIYQESAHESSSSNWEKFDDNSEAVAV